MKQNKSKCNVIELTKRIQNDHHRKGKFFCNKMQENCHNQTHNESSVIGRKLIITREMLVLNKKVKV